MADNKQDTKNRYVVRSAKAQHIYGAGELIWAKEMTSSQAIHQFGDPIDTYTNDNGLRVRVTIENPDVK